MRPGSADARQGDNASRRIIERVSQSNKLDIPSQIGANLGTFNFCVIFDIRFIFGSTGASLDYFVGMLPGLVSFLRVIEIETSYWTLRFKNLATFSNAHDSRMPHGKNSNSICWTVIVVARLDLFCVYHLVVGCN